MELDYRITGKQRKQLASFNRAMGEQTSWALARHEGTGCRFWRITWADAPEWNGDTESRDGKTLELAIRAVLQSRDAYRG